MIIRKNDKTVASVIITAHSEGLLLHKTIKSVREAIETANKQEYDFEIILHIDNPDEKTKEYLNRVISQEKDIIVFENNFKDLGLSRNYAINNSKGDVVFVIDGDDLISKDWLSKALELIRKSEKPIIVHPEYNLTFGTHVNSPVLWKMEDSLSLEEDKVLLAGVNLWCSMCAAKKEIFIQFPYKQAGKGFGNEDWEFNSRTRNANIEHKVAKGVVQFYRRKADSLLSSNEHNKLVQWKNPLFDLEEYKKIELPKTEQKSIKPKLYYSKKIFRKTHGFLLKTPLKIVLNPVASKVKKIIGYNNRKKEKIPKEVLEKWANINSIETQLYPVEWRTNNVELYTNIDKVVVGKTLRTIIESMSKKPQYVFIVPWLATGGGDKVVLNYIDALIKIAKDTTVAVITTERNNNEWAKKLPKNAYLLDFGNATARLNDLDKEKVFSRLLVELECEKIHLINSQYGYSFIEEHKELIKNNFKLYVSIFNYEFISGSNYRGIYDYADPALFEIYDVVEKIFTDNKTNVERLVDRCGFDRNKFSVHYQPVQINKEEEQEKTNDVNDKCRILWAGRITEQKNPDLLVKIAKKLDSNKYQIDVYGVIGEDYSEKMFNNIQTIKYKGGFEKFSEIDNKKYDMFLYTSTTDGVPNIILEAIAARIPVIASNDGGVGEVILDKKTGILVRDYYEVDEYIRAIEFAESNKETMKKYSANALNLALRQHSEEQFIKKIKEDISCP